MFAVADGLGSAEFAESGSRLAADVAVNAFTEKALAWRMSPSGGYSPGWEQLLKGSVAQAHSALVREAKSRRIEPHELATTLLVGMVLRRGHLAYAQVGDGLIVARFPSDPGQSNSGEGSSGDQSSEPNREEETPERLSVLRKITAPQGEGHKTPFLPSRTGLTGLQWGVTDAPVSGVAAFTDGFTKLTNMAGDPKKSGPTDAFLGEMIRRATRISAYHGEEKARSELKGFLRSEETWIRTSDDITLLMAVPPEPREKIGADRKGETSDEEAEPEKKKDTLDKPPPEQISARKEDRVGPTRLQGSL